MFKEKVKSILPGNIKLRISSYRKKNLGRYYIKSYSQEGEDMILRRLFETQRTGFYVDVGAHHPKRFSNTYFFYKKKWRGINIDAKPGSMILFNKVRPKDINIEKPVSDVKQVLTYYAFNESALNGFSKELSEKRNRMHEYSIKYTKELETSTLEEILDSNLPQQHKIDFLSIDVEGMDLRVLMSCNLDRYQPNIILIEILESTLSDVMSNEITRYLANYDYKIYAKAVNTVFFVHKSFLCAG